MALRLKVGPRQSIRAKVLPRWPSHFIAGTGIAITYSGGHPVISFDGAPASLVSFTPTAEVSATNVQDAIEEVVADLPDFATQAETNAGTNDSTIVTPLKLATRPAFHGHKNGSNQASILSATFTKVTFTTEVFDKGGFYDAANSKWVPPSGLYLITANVLVNAGAVDATEGALLIYKNGTALYQSSLSFSGTGAQTLRVSGIVSADGDDEFEIYTFIAGAGTKTIGGGPAETAFNGMPL